jgi:hypothetical protein
MVGWEEARAANQPPPAHHEPPRPCPPERIALHMVGAAVGNVRNDRPELVATAADLFTA